MFSPLRAAAAALMLALCTVTGVALAANREEEAEARLRRDITILASDEYEGRGIGTKGLDKAAAYIAKQFGEAGLKPGGVGGTWFQPFPFSGSAEHDGTSKVVLHGPGGEEVKLTQGQEFNVMGFSAGGKANAPLVFVGYGATAPRVDYDDYKGIDVKGKVVVLLRHTPRWADQKRPFDGSHRDEHASLENKQALAETDGAAAVILVNDTTELPDDTLVPFEQTARARSTSHLPYVQVKRDVINPIVRAVLGKSLSAIEREIDRDLKPQSAALTGWTVSVDAKVKRKTEEVKNVVGVLEGKGPLADEIVVIGAHYDHLGYGGSGSLARDRSKKEIHHGADDNASGTTTLLELARMFGERKDRQGRRLVFMAFTAEESGLVGSRYYVKQPLFALDKTVAMVNLDMVGRLRADKESGKDKLYIEGSGTAKSFDKMLETTNPGFKLVKKPGGNGPSDHDSFYNSKIPVVFFWTGNHEDYHRPSDTADKINVAGMRKVAGYAARVIDILATEADRPAYVSVASSHSTGGGPKGPRLGIMPDYENNAAGLRIDVVSKDGAADKAGIKSGDVIVELAGRPVTNVNTYMVLMAQQRAGQPVEVTVLREGQKLRLKVTPQ